MNKYSTLFLLFFSAFIISCSSDDDITEPVIPDGDFANGTLILNEGGFSGGSSVSFISNDLSEVENSIFENTNPGQSVGLFPQSIFFDGDRAFIISNGSNIISVVNRFTFELIETIDGDLDVPRYGTVLNGKVYVTNQAAFDSDQDDFIAVIDLETLQVQETFLVGAVANHIVNSNGIIFIQNPSLFGSENPVSSISVFDPSSNNIDEVIQVGDDLNSLKAFNNNVYALDDDGLKIINTVDFSIETVINKPSNLTSLNNLRIESGQMYYTSGNAVYSSSISSGELSSEPIFDYGSELANGALYGFDVHEGQFYLADAGDFASDGTVFIYSSSGDLLADFTVGLNPNGFYFQ
ncbi:YncE family protein [Psychroflexus montanilacus]|uniref:YncE family protein n=1 Tax=Psychroflexus montanilacus TaxID=2873598 RepID=UPI001CCE7A8C|nr:DUF5074 domain-containing protein [Psychroflexus montanilacus]MBZ9650809.1 cell surface protein [Psychroflexus montanilacus]